MKYEFAWFQIAKLKGFCVYEYTNVGDFTCTQNTLAYTWKIKNSTPLSSKWYDFSYQHYLNVEK